MLTQITQVFRLHPECYDTEARKHLRGGGSPFEIEEVSVPAPFEIGEV